MAVATAACTKTRKQRAIAFGKMFDLQYAAAASAGNSRNTSGRRERSGRGGNSDIFAGQMYEIPHDFCIICINPMFRESASRPRSTRSHGSGVTWRSLLQGCQGQDLYPRPSGLKALRPGGPSQNQAINNSLHLKWRLAS